jgi:asparagine synthase (glutamine-hydrolysing)
MAELMDRPVRTFTIGFRDNPIHNEIEEARFVAREYGTDHHEVLITQRELLDFLPELIFHQDEPIADPVCVPLYYVSKLARETGTKVVQVGEGSDELFCGYRDYALYLELHNRVWRYLARLPAPMRRAMGAVGQALCRTGAQQVLPKGRKMLPDVFRRLAEGEALFWSGAFVFDEVNKQRLLTRETQQRLGAGCKDGLSSYSVVRSDLDRLLASKPDADQLLQMSYLELKLRLPELQLMRVDKMTMATSVEARVPFLDHKLVEFAMSIPSSLKYRDRETKYILKRALEGVIPNRVLNREKKGFGVPIDEWMHGPFGSFVESAVFTSKLRQRGLFDYDFVKHLLAEHQRGRGTYAFFLWNLLNVSLWYDQWIEGPRPASEAVESTAAKREVATS